MSKLWEHLEGRGPVLKSQPTEMVRACDEVVVELDGRLRKVSALKAGVRMLLNKLGYFKLRESTNCDVEVTTSTVADA